MSCCNIKEARKFYFNKEDLICYCFKYSKQELFDAIQFKQERKILDDIKLKMKKNGCFCKTANPSGQCCLTDLQEFIAHFKE